MTSQLVKSEVHGLEVWNEENITSLKEMFAADLTPIEFKIFINLGKHLNANPFTREIWAVKYDKSKPASIFCGRDFYRKRGQSQPDYIWHTAQPVFENDTYEENCGQLIKHVPTLKNPGQLVLAYCIIKRQNKPDFFLKVFFHEYNQGFSQWKSKPISMLCKVAEAQAFRQAYQAEFEGTYCEGEETDYNAGKQAIDVKNESAEPKDDKKTYTIGEVMAVISGDLTALVRKYKLGQASVVSLFNEFQGDEAQITAAINERHGVKTESEAK